MAKSDQVLEAIRKLDERMAALETQAERSASTFQSRFDALEQRMSAIELQLGKIAGSLLAPSERKNLGILGRARSPGGNSSRNSGGNNAAIVAKVPQRVEGF